MATAKVQVGFSASLDLSESEMRALDALVGYGTQPFLDVFYEKMGRNYLEPHEAGLRALFSSVTDHVRRHLATIDDARAKLGLRSKS